MGDESAEYVWTYVSANNMIEFFTWDCEEVAVITRYINQYNITDVEIMHDVLYIAYIDKTSTST